jgi:hypothetical protein
MKTRDKYRFSLQWGAETTEKTQAGDLLESLGNRKSEFVVAAVTEYVSNHPETSIAGQKLKIVVRPNFTREELETMIRAVIEEKPAGIAPVVRENGLSDSESAAIAPNMPDVEEMLKNLDMFST